MRLAIVLLLSASAGLAQFKSTVPLVVAPVTVTDAKGRFIDGLTEKELFVYDNNVRQKIQVDTLIHPISLVVMIQASVSAAAVLDKLGGSGILFTELLSAEAGETALVSCSDDVRILQEFTGDPDRLSRALRHLRPQGQGAAIVDGIHESLRMLAARDQSRRRVLLVIAERRDRSSRMVLADLMAEGQLQNTTIYWLTYSTLLVPFTARPKTAWDRMTDEEKKNPERFHSSKFPLPEEEEPLPPETGGFNLLNIFTELNQKAKTDAAALLSRTTGGRTFSFLKQSGLEAAIQAVASEVHRQYMVTFQPKPDKAGLFHGLRVEVNGLPELSVRTRVGYWAVP